MPRGRRGRRRSSSSASSMKASGVQAPGGVGAGETDKEPGGRPLSCSMAAPGNVCDGVQGVQQPGPRKPGSRAHVPLGSVPSDQRTYSGRPGLPGSGHGGPREGQRLPAGEGLGVGGASLGLEPAGRSRRLVLRPQFLLRPRLPHPVAGVGPALRRSRESLYK